LPASAKITGSIELTYRVANKNEFRRRINGLTFGRDYIARAMATGQCTHPR
jgi:hypothetical protein